MKLYCKNIGIVILVDNNTIYLGQLLQITVMTLSYKSTYVIGMIVKFDNPSNTFNMDPNMG